MKLEKSYTVSHYISDFLKFHGVNNVFELSGGMIAFLTDAIANHGAINVISNKHEQAAGFAAEGSSRVEMKPGVALATSGPGATNLITAIASCFFDSSPVLFITGQVNQLEIRKNKKQRQNGFQELDIVSAVLDITKYAKQIQTASEIPKVLEDAWNSTLEGRPGPALIDIPINIQQLEIEFFLPNSKKKYKKANSVLRTNYTKLYELLIDSKKPLVIAGGGIRTSKTIKEFNDFIDKTNLPVVTTLMGTDTMSREKRNLVGFIGSYGNRWANHALFQSDLVLALGSRLDVRQTGNSIEEFINGKKIVRVEIDKAELEGRIPADLAFHTNLSNFFMNFRTFI